MTYRYGEFSEEQVDKYKQKMRKQIFFLLLAVDPKTKEKFENVDVDEAFENVMHTLAGYNDLLGCPMEMVLVLSSLQEARTELHRDNFRFATYRKLILDAGSEVLKVKGGA